MRLTLRSLLAYLDDSLDAPEAEELGKKIEESEFARALVHRMRSATRRLRLGAPKLGGKGMGLDPNTVAEYLDYTLAPDRVQDFEQVCLESDVHLAEVAACHQILTNVLAGVADVDVELREKIVRLGTEPATSDDADAADTSLSAREPGIDPNAARSSEVVDEEDDLPDESVLDPSHLSGQAPAVQWPIVAILVAALLLVGLFVLNPFGRREPVVDRSASVAKDGGDAEAKATARQRAKEENTSLKENTSVTPPEQESPGADAGVERQPPDRSAEPSKEVPSSEGGDENSKGSEIQPSEADASVEPRGEQVHAEPDRPAPATPADSNHQEKPTDLLAKMAAADAAKEAEAAGAETKKLELPADPTIAKLTSADQPLGRWDDQEETYFRVPPLSMLEAGDRVIALPLTRPQLLIPNSPPLQWTLVGPARMEFPSDASRQPYRFRLISGRTVWVRHGEAPASWEVKAGGRVFRLTMEAPTTKVAIAIHQAVPTGIDPAQAERHVGVEILAVDGPLDVTVEGGKPVEVVDGQVYWKIDAEPPRLAPVEELPDWIESTSMTQLERGAVEEVVRSLALGRPMLLALHELADHRRVEVRSLAVESLISAGEFWPLVDSLGDRKMKAYWSRQLEAVRTAICEDPAYAEKLRRVLQQRRGEEGKELYRMLWGYTNEQLQEGADRELVTYLESDSLDLRVVAFDTLHRITGTTFLYRPDRSPKTQRVPIRKWRHAASEGKIRHSRSPRPTWIEGLEGQTVTPEE